MKSSKIEFITKLPDGTENLTISLIPENEFEIQALKATLECNADDDQIEQINGWLRFFIAKKGYTVVGDKNRINNVFSLYCISNQKNMNSSF